MKKVKQGNLDRVCAAVETDRTNRLEFLFRFRSTFGEFPFTFTIVFTFKGILL